MAFTGFTHPRIHPSTQNASQVEEPLVADMNSTILLTKCPLLIKLADVWQRGGWQCCLGMPLPTFPSTLSIKPPPCQAVLV